MKKTWMILLPVGAAFLVSGALWLARPWQPQLPVDVSYRHARFDPSEVAQFHNDSDSDRKVVVAINSPTTGETIHKVVMLRARGEAEIGWMQGWSFVSGERIEIHQAGFRDRVEIVP